MLNGTFLRGVLQLFQLKVLKISSGTVLEQTSPRPNILSLAKTIAEQKNVPFNVLHLSHKHSRTASEQFWNIVLENFITFLK